jgi:hypothetical protein
VRKRQLYRMNVSLRIENSALLRENKDLHNRILVLMSELDRLHFNETSPIKVTPRGGR